MDRLDVLCCFQWTSSEDISDHMFCRRRLQTAFWKAGCGMDPSLLHERLQSIPENSYQFLWKMPLIKKRTLSGNQMRFCSDISHLAYGKMFLRVVLDTLIGTATFLDQKGELLPILYRILYIYYVFWVFSLKTWEHCSKGSCVQTHIWNIYCINPLSENRPGWCSIYSCLEGIE